MKNEYGISLVSEEQLKTKGTYDAIVLAVAHDSFKELDIRALKKNSSIVYDVKGVLPMEEIDERL